MIGYKQRMGLEANASAPIQSWAVGCKGLCGALVLFFIEKAYVLLVFGGIWALMEGINDIVRAFAIQGLHEEVPGGTATEGSHT